MSSLTSYLAKKGAVDPRVLQQVLLNQAIRGGGIGLNLLEAMAIDEGRLVELSGKFYRLPAMTTGECLASDGAVVRSLPRQLCVELDIVPVRREEGELLVACLEPLSRSDMASVERAAGCRVRLTLVSPLALPLIVAWHHDVPLDARVARVLASRGKDRLAVSGVLPEIASRIEELIASAAGPAENSGDADEAVSSDDDWSDLDDLEDLDEPVPEEPEPRSERDSIVGKYIIINRIGTRRRRPSIHAPAVKVSMPPKADEPATEAPPAETKPVEAEITFATGDVKASSDTRPHRPSRPPLQSHGSVPPPRRQSSVPPAVLAEVLQDYLQSDVSPPLPVMLTDTRSNGEGAPLPGRKDTGAGLDGPTTQDQFLVGRTISVGTVPEAQTHFIEKHSDDMGRDARRRSKPSRQELGTLPGIKLEDLGVLMRPPIQGYAVDVPELVSLQEILLAVEGAAKANDVIDVLHRYALQFFDFVMLMRYRKGRFEVTALSSRGWAWPVQELADRFMGYDQLPDTIRKLGQPHLGPVIADSRIAAFLGAIGRPLPANAIMMPITLKGRAIVVIYGDNGNNPVAFDEAHDLFHATWVATNSLLGLLDQKR